jgi:hypothetical protein
MPSKSRVAAENAVTAMGTLSTFSARFCAVITISVRTAPLSASAANTAAGAMTLNVAARSSRIKRFFRFIGPLPGRDCTRYFWFFCNNPRRFNHTEYFGWRGTAGAKVCPADAIIRCLQSGAHPARNAIDAWALWG